MHAYLPYYVQVVPNEFQPVCVLGRPSHTFCSLVSCSGSTAVGGRSGRGESGTDGIVERDQVSLPELGASPGDLGGLAGARPSPLSSADSRIAW